MTQEKKRFTLRCFNLNAVFLRFFLIVGICAYCTSSFGQCSAEFYSAHYFKNLHPYTVLKSYRIDGKNGKRKEITYTIVFNEFKKYRLLVESKDGGSDIIANIMDFKKNICATISAGKESLNYVDFTVPTGIYYLSFSYKDSRSHCGAAQLGVLEE